MILIVDNYDSFTYNIVHTLEAQGTDVIVWMNDDARLTEVLPQDIGGIILSPGPCTPSESGHCKTLIEKETGSLPILGICLGHQAIGEVFGGATIRATSPMHGRSSHIRYEEDPLFIGLPQNFSAGRYHSLIVDLPKDTPLIPLATSEDGVLMAMKHVSHPTYGIQFHPESILTPHGPRLLANFTDLCETWLTSERQVA
ncbi:MAG: aminodeoxychorismate/anthranilate synthase component II [Pseudobdellovibrionaceae bacterium]